MNPREWKFSEPPVRWEYEVPADYMVGFIPDLTFSNVLGWIDPRNLRQCERRDFEGFTLWASVDHDWIPGREVTLGRIEGPSDEGQHIHHLSDAFVIVTAGEAVLLMGELERRVRAPKLIRIPRGTPHGFRLRKGEFFEFLSAQNPAIRDAETGHEDFHRVGQQ